MQRTINLCARIAKTWHEKRTGIKKSKFKMYLGDLTPLHFAAFTGAYEIQTYRKNRVSTEFIKYVLVRCNFASRNIMNAFHLCTTSANKPDSHNSNVSHSALENHHHKLWSQLLRVIRRRADKFLKQQSWFYFILLLLLQKRIHSLIQVQRYKDLIYNFIIKLNLVVWVGVGLTCNEI